MTANVFQRSEIWSVYENPSFSSNLLLLPVAIATTSQPWWRNEIELNILLLLMDAGILYACNVHGSRHGREHRRIYNQSGGVSHWFLYIQQYYYCINVCGACNPRRMAVLDKQSARYCIVYKVSKLYYKIKNQGKSQCVFHHHFTYTGISNNCELI